MEVENSLYPIYDFLYLGPHYSTNDMNLLKTRNINLIINVATEKGIKK